MCVLDYITILTIPTSWTSIAHIPRGSPCQLAGELSAGHCCQRQNHSLRDPAVCVCALEERGRKEREVERGREGGRRGWKEREEEGEGGRRGRKEREEGEGGRIGRKEREEGEGGRRGRKEREEGEGERRGRKEREEGEEKEKKKKGGYLRERVEKRGGGRAEEEVGEKGGGRGQSIQTTGSYVMLFDSSLNGRRLHVNAHHSNKLPSSLWRTQTLNQL